MIFTTVLTMAILWLPLSFGAPHDMQQMASHSAMTHGHHDLGNEHSHGAVNHHQRGSMGTHWMIPKDAARRKNPIPLTQASIQSGKDMFQNNCLSCHGTGARGDGPLAKALTPKPTDLVMMSLAHPDGDLAWKIAEGRGAMPGWKQTLSEKEIWDVVNYLKSLSDDELKPKPKAHHDHHQHAH